MPFEIEIILITVSLALLMLYLNARAKASAAETQLAYALSQKQSQSVRYGKTAEQFFPFLEHYPYNPQNFRFLGTPVDGVQFEGNRIVFVEFKAGGKLSEKQQRIKHLVASGSVEFEEFRI